jgi:hypothetical protein
MIDDIENIIDDDKNDSDELCEFVSELIQEEDDPEKAMKILRRKYQLAPSKRTISSIYKKYFSSTKITPRLRKWMIKKQMFSNYWFSFSKKKAKSKAKTVNFF